MVKEIGNELERNAEVCNRAALEVNPCYPITLQLSVFILAQPPAPLTSQKRYDMHYLAALPWRLFLGIERFMLSFTNCIIVYVRS